MKLHLMSKDGDMRWDGAEGYSNYEHMKKHGYLLICNPTNKCYSDRKKREIFCVPENHYHSPVSDGRYLRKSFWSRSLSRSQQNRLLSFFSATPHNLLIKCYYERHQYLVCKV